MAAASNTRVTRGRAIATGSRAMDIITEDDMTNGMEAEAILASCTFDNVQGEVVVPSKDLMEKMVKDLNWALTRQRKNYADWLAAKEDLARRQAEATAKRAADKAAREAAEAAYRRTPEYAAEWAARQAAEELEKRLRANRLAEARSEREDRYNPQH